VAAARVGALHRRGLGGAAEGARRQRLPVGEHLLALHVQGVVMTVHRDAAAGEPEAVTPRGVLGARRWRRGDRVGAVADLAGRAAAAQVARHVSRGVLELVILRRRGRRRG